MLTPTQVAKIANVHPNSIRNWSTRFGEFLSPDARGEKGNRLYMERDIEVLCMVAALNKSGVPLDEIAGRLRDGDVPPVVDVATPNLQHPPQTTQTGLEATFALQAILSSHSARLDALERSAAVKDEQRKERRDVALTWFLVGVFVTVVIVALVVGMG
jgi:DNA-binding transcriptional MerR regulator